MRLKEVVAEHLYWEDFDKKTGCLFKEQSSNVRDFYFKVATDELAKMLPSYLSNNGYLTRIIRGAVKDFTNIHKLLTIENSESLVKRIVSNLRKQGTLSSNIIPIEVASIQTKNYKEVIEIRVPVRFYWDEDGFDGIEFGEFKTTLLPWEEAMVQMCLKAIAPAIREKE